MEFKTATTEEIKKFESDKRDELRGLRFSASGSKNRNVKLARSLRRDIARSLTELTARGNELVSAAE